MLTKVVNGVRVTLSTEEEGEINISWLNPLPVPLPSDRALLRAAIADLALVLVRLVEKLLADGVIVATDFRPTPRQAYQDAKEIADRLDPPP